VLFPEQAAVEPAEEELDSAVDKPDRVAGEPLAVRLRQFTGQHMKVLSALALAAVIFATWMVMQARSVPLDEPVATPSWTEPEPSSSATELWLVPVVGAVAQPGVVSVPAGARVIDAIEAAGGFTAEADAADLNLAAVLVDGCQIVVGTTAEPQGEVHQGFGGDDSDGNLGGSGSTGGAATINLNQATEAQLDTLPGVGPVTAKAILAWRQQNGSFTSVAQLQEVDGIGPKTFAQIEPYVSV
jgi:competence protein ComEA